MMEGDVTSGHDADAQVVSTTELAERLITACFSVGPMVVAFSGGVDSALLAVAARRAVPAATWLVTADSASLADGELEHCRAFAERWALPWQAVPTAEIADDRYLANGD